MVDKEVQIKWTPKMSVGEKNIDNQHKRLINELIEIHSNLQQQSSLSKSRELIHFLDKHIPEHFTYEEAYMEKNNSCWNIYYYSCCYYRVYRKIHKHLNVYEY